MDCGSLPHADETVSAGLHRRAASAPFVADLDRQLLIAVANQHRCTRRTGVLDDVGQRLLGDAVRSETDPGRDRASLSLDSQIDGKPGFRHLGDQRGEIVEAGRRGTGWFRSA